MSEISQKNPNWVIENFLEVKNNQLYIDGVSTIALTQKFDTPLFVFSESRINHNIQRLKQAGNEIGCPLKICYAAKANSNMGILRAVRDAGSDLEVNSGGELYKALKIGFLPAQIIFNGTSKTVTELQEAINEGIYAIQADSIYEIELIEKVAKSLNKRANVSLRIVPDIETGTHAGLKTAMNSSKFGMTWEDALTAFHRWDTEDEFLNLCGIHLHVGSQTPNPEPYTDALIFLFEKMKTIFTEAGHRLSHLNLGGGFPVNYLRDDSNASSISNAEKAMFAADFAPSEAIAKAWLTISGLAKQTNSTELLENIELLIEPGRSVIADAGICLTTVHNRKERPLQKTVNAAETELNKKSENTNSPLSTLHSPLNKDTWLLTDAGFNILLSMETYKWYYHLISAQRAGESHTTPYKLAGPLCDGGDVYFDIEGENRLPDYRLLPENVQPQEVLALLNCGAYSIAQMFQYNGRFLPAIVLIRKNGDVELVRRRDVYEDLITNDIW
jgi:D-ornithine/D-lysine decarboxylase